MTYAKLASSILDSTIWSEAKEVKILWITMLAMKDEYGVIHASLPGLAKRAGLTVSECDHALTRLFAPDPYSRTKDHEGRRIEVVDGGWAVLNHGKYRHMASAEDRKEQQRLASARYRAKRTEQPDDRSAPDDTF